mmetsp:Transcript_1489/g.5294  ORF Transcript_1489/g.5294 Transcript_1489/m.5294 type:complete len:171 (-) Transcript_1489:176-688(-)
MLGTLAGSFATCGSIALGAQVALPLPKSVSELPVTGQTLGAAVSGLLLGPLSASLGAALYIAAAATGLPVLAGGRHGPPPRGSWGFLGGFVFCSGICGVLKDRRCVFGHPVLVAALGQAGALAAGASWMVVGMGSSCSAAWTRFVLPFLPGLALKSLAAWLIVSAVGPTS